MDSATALAIAREGGFRCFTLSCRYGQRHAAELEAARRLSSLLGAVEHREIDIPIGQFGGSALTEDRLAVPEDGGDGIPITYVPARNTVLLSVALAWAEVLEANAIFIGVNAVDYSGYPDCRPEFIAAFQRVVDLATKRTAEGAAIELAAPLLELSKAQIIQRASALGVDLALTVTCYRADRNGYACGQCDACRLRAEGFAAAGIADCTRYREPDVRGD
jgi:7-cyano-7-deazaguanine synthase